MAVVRQVYDHAGMDFSPQSEAAVRQWWIDNPADKHGAHRYELADYGLTRDQVESVYADYIAQYGEFL